MKAAHRKLLNLMQDHPTSRFLAARSPFGTNHMLLIQDYMWWTDNEREILNWMAANLPRGIEHQQGMIVTLDSEEDRMMFLLRWA